MQTCLSFVLSTTTELYILIQSSHSILWPLTRNPWHQSSITGICQAIPLGCFFLYLKHFVSSFEWRSVLAQEKTWAKATDSSRMLFSKGRFTRKNTDANWAASPRNNPVMHSYMYIYCIYVGLLQSHRRCPSCRLPRQQNVKKVSAGPHVCLVSTIFNTHHAASHAYMRDA